MCGISGFIKFDKRITDIDKSTISKMNSTLMHRGPDMQDAITFDNVAFGFSRLSIIGIENGMQPIWNENETIVLICNGEIFNYVELRQELIERGHNFKTRSDVEVIIHLYEDYGVDFLNKLNGQFAFALFDKRKQQLFCARDQMGIIPFFYTVVDNVFVFASEIKAILKYPGLQKEVDLVGLDQVFTFAGLISPRTMFKNVSSLENGHFLTINKGNIIKQEYWDLNFSGEVLESFAKTEADYTDQLEELFERSIKLRLRADVPLGFYVSGGLDSSMIAMKVNQLFPFIKKEAFSIDFIESQYSESYYQDLIAAESNSILSKKTFLYSDIIERLRHSVYHSECPIKETYNTASLSLSESVKRKGIKVVLSGEGADEFFAGYVGYRFDKMRALKLIQNNSSPQEAAIRARLFGDESFFYERNFTEFDDVKKRIYSDAVNASYEEINCLNHHVINKDKLKNCDLLSKRTYIDYKLRLVDHLVSDHGDRMALANSIEVRYPFLDKDIVEFSTKIPSELKLKEFNEKYILRKMASRFVPKKITDREKFHFIAPGSPFLLQNDVEFVNDMLSYDSIKRQGYFDPQEIEILKSIYKQNGYAINAPYESDLLITVLTFNILLDTFF